MTIPEAFHMAVQHHQAGRLAQAEQLYRQILAVQPDHADAHHDLGLLALRAGRPGVAAESFRQTVASSPGNVVAQANLGRALAEQRLLDEALAAFDRALEINPDFAEAMSHRAEVLGKLGLIEQAVAAYRRVLELNPTSAADHSSLIFTLLLQPGCDRATIEAEQKTWDARFGAPCGCSVQPHANVRDSKRRLRVGYISADFRAHIAGFNLLPLFRNHDHGNFEIICYSAVRQTDALTEEFRRCANHWREIAVTTDDEVVEMIRADGVDILVDLMQHTAGNRLPVFARKPAPVQVSFGAYPGGAGVGAIPHRISDRWLESLSCNPHPVADREPVEPASFPPHLLDSFWCYRECVVNVPLAPPPASRAGRVTFGNLGNTNKVNAAVLRLWARVLHRVSRSRLLLLCDEGSARRRVLELLQSEGISSDRVEFSPRCVHGKYLELYQRLDVVLDTFPYNGHTTSLDALWMGVPVVTLPGGTAVSRAGLSILQTMGLPELVAASEEEFVNIAAQLAGDLSRLTLLRSALRDRLADSVLVDALRFARNIECGYRRMWREWCADKSEE